MENKRILEGLKTERKLIESFEKSESDQAIDFVSTTCSSNLAKCSSKLAKCSTNSLFHSLEDVDRTPLLSTKQSVVKISERDLIEDLSGTAGEQELKSVDPWFENVKFEHPTFTTSSEKIVKLNPSAVDEEMKALVSVIKMDMNQGEKKATPQSAIDSEGEKKAAP